MPSIEEIKKGLDGHVCSISVHLDQLGYHGTGQVTQICRSIRQEDFFVALGSGLIQRYHVDGQKLGQYTGLVSSCNCLLTTQWGNAYRLIASTDGHNGVVRVWPFVTAFESTGMLQRPMNIDFKSNLGISESPIYTMYVSGSFLYISINQGVVIYDLAGMRSVTLIEEEEATNQNLTIPHNATVTLISAHNYLHSDPTTHGVKDLRSIGSSRVLAERVTALCTTSSYYAFESDEEEEEEEEEGMSSIKLCNLLICGDKKGDVHIWDLKDVTKRETAPRQKGKYSTIAEIDKPKRLYDKKMLLTGDCPRNHTRCASNIDITLT